MGSIYPACQSLLREGTSSLPDKTAGLFLCLRNHLCLLPVGLQYFRIDFLLILTGTKSHLGARDKSGKMELPAWNGFLLSVRYAVPMGGPWEIKPPGSAAHSAVHRDSTM